MAFSRPMSNVIEPWEGTGWPSDLFKDRENLSERRLYFCTRNDCGKKNNRILRDPYQLSCGHRVCKACLEYIRDQPENSGQRICDACKEELFDEARNRIVASMAISSPMDLDQHSAPTLQMSQQSMDIDAQPAVQDLAHAKIDPDKTITDRAASREINKLEVICPFECGITEVDDKKLIIRNLERHMSECEERKVPCEKCTDIIKFKDLAEHQRNECQFRLVECPNGCGKRGLQEKDVAKHMAECENKPPVCTLYKVIVLPIAEAEVEYHTKHMAVNYPPLFCLLKNPYEGSHHEHLTTKCVVDGTFNWLYDEDDEEEVEPENYSYRRNRERHQGLNRDVERNKYPNLYDVLMDDYYGSILSILRSYLGGPTVMFDDWDSVTRERYQRLGRQKHRQLRKEIKCWKNLIPDETGWPIDVFIEQGTLEDYYCTYCGNEETKRILRDPYQLSCGHRVCKACLDAIGEKPPDKRDCKSCKNRLYNMQLRDLSNLIDENQPFAAVYAEHHTPVDHGRFRIEVNDAFHDRAASREVDRLAVKCPHCSGTTVNGEKLCVRNIKKHVAECPARLALVESRYPAEVMDNGRLIWKIDQVQARRNEAQSRHSVYSHPFYTEHFGHKMCVRLYFNGTEYGRGTHVSLSLVRLEGRNDPALKSYSKTLTVQLINQKKLRNMPDVVEKFRPELTTSPCMKPLFCAQDIVFRPENGYVVDDVMYIVVTEQDAGVSEYDVLVEVDGGASSDEESVESDLTEEPLPEEAVGGGLSVEETGRTA